MNRQEKKESHNSKRSFAQQISDWCDWSITTSIYAVAFLTPFIFTWVNSELFEFNKILFVYAIAILSVGALVIKMILHKKWLVRRTIFDIPMGLFVGSSVLSTVFSIHPYTSFWGYYSRFNGGLASVLAYTALFYVATSTLNRKHLPALLITLVISLFGSSLYAFPEHFGYSPSCTLIRGEFSVDCWKQDVQQRVFGTFGQPNWLAAYIVLLLPLTIVLPAISKKAPIQALAIGATVLSYPTLLFTKSRSGFLSFAISMGFLAIGLAVILFKLFSTKYPRTEKVRKLVYLAAICGFLFCTSLLFGTQYSPSFSQLMQKLQTQSVTEESVQEVEVQPVNRLEVGGTDSGEIRMIVWKGAIDVWRRYPLLGSGVETFAYSYYLDRPIAHNDVSEWDFLYNKAHNEFLNLLATTGIVGLFSYVLLLGWLCTASLVVAIKRIKNATASTLQSSQTVQDSFLLVSLVAGVIAVSVSNFLGFATVAVSVVLYLFFVVAQLIISTEKSDTNAIQESEPSFSIWQKIGVGILFVTVLLFLLGISNRWRADWYYNEGMQAARQSYVQESIPFFLKAIQLQPNEAVFYDDLANSYSKIGFVLAQQDIQKIAEDKVDEETTEETNEDEDQTEEADASLYEQLTPQTQQFIQMSVTASDTALTLNAAHLNFYKTRTRIMLLFSELDQVFLDEAERTNQLAMRLSPTDPKLILAMAEIKLIQGDTTTAIELLEKSVSLKPNYETARMALAELYVETENYTAAREQYEYVLDRLSPQNEIALKAIQELSEMSN